MWADPLAVAPTCLFVPNDCNWGLGDGCELKFSCSDINRNCSCCRKICSWSKRCFCTNCSFRRNCTEVSVTSGDCRKKETLLKRCVVFLGKVFNSTWLMEKFSRKYCGLQRKFCLIFENQETAVEENGFAWTYFPLAPGKNLWGDM